MEESVVNLKHKLYTSPEVISASPLNNKKEFHLTIEVGVMGFVFIFLKIIFVHFFFVKKQWFIVKRYTSTINTTVFLSRKTKKN